MAEVRLTAIDSNVRAVPRGSTFRGVDPVPWVAFSELDAAMAAWASTVAADRAIHGHVDLDVTVLTDDGWAYSISTTTWCPRSGPVDSLQQFLRHLEAVRLAAATVQTGRRLAGDESIGVGLELVGVMFSVLVAGGAS